ncbi:MAG: type VII toxin-antitoxin system HepT family RNase toxin [Candidatus Asgardarchaeia archaeon]
MLLDTIMDAIRVLEKISKLKEDDVLNDVFIVGSLLWNLYVAIQGCIDLALKVSSMLNLSTPETYADVFRNLANEGVISKELLDRLVSMAKFRNKLAHIYASIDVTRVYRNLKDNINDIKVFLRIITEFLKKYGFDITNF